MLIKIIYMHRFHRYDRLRVDAVICIYVQASNELPEFFRKKNLIGFHECFLHRFKQVFIIFFEQKTTGIQTYDLRIESLGTTVKL